MLRWPTEDRQHSQESMAEGAWWNLTYIHDANICICQLKKDYGIVKEIWNASGFGWDPIKHFVTAEPDVWTDYIKVSATVCLVDVWTDGWRPVTRPVLFLFFS